MGTAAWVSSLLSVYTVHTGLTSDLHSPSIIPNTTQRTFKASWDPTSEEMSIQVAAQEIRNNEPQIVSDIGSKVSQETACSRQTERDRQSPQQMQNPPDHLSTQISDLVLNQDNNSQAYWLLWNLTTISPHIHSYASCRDSTVDTTVSPYNTQFYSQTLPGLSLYHLSLTLFFSCPMLGL